MATNTVQKLFSPDKYLWALFFSQPFLIIKLYLLLQFVINKLKREKKNIRNTNSRMVMLTGTQITEIIMMCECESFRLLSEPASTSTAV